MTTSNNDSIFKRERERDSIASNVITSDKQLDFSVLRYGKPFKRIETRREHARFGLETPRSPTCVARFEETFPANKGTATAASPFRRQLLVADRPENARLQREKKE